MLSRKFISGNQTMSNQCLSSSTSEINIDDDDDDSNTVSIDVDSNSQLKYNNYPQSVTTDNEHKPYRRRKQPKFKKTKSHRIIEKRRRDRMNRSLDTLLDLIPHKKPDNQRRIEKTEIIEIAIKYIRNFVSSNEKSCKIVEAINLNRKSNLKIDAYHSGYHNGIYDLFEYTQKNLNNDKFLSDLVDYIDEQEVQLEDLTVVPDKKSKIFLSKKSPQDNCDISKSRDNLCAISDKEAVENHDNFSQFSIDEQQNPIQQIKVPIFALHPSGTHYIPMCIDSSIIIQAFNNKSKNEQYPCHPISIPVNFNSISSISDQYELDIQNINVIATRHQTSVKPN